MEDETSISSCRSDASFFAPKQPVQIEIVGIGHAASLRSCHRLSESPVERKLAPGGAAYCPLEPGSRVADRADMQTAR